MWSNVNIFVLLSLRFVCESNEPDLSESMIFVPGHAMCIIFSGEVFLRIYSILESTVM